MDELHWSDYISGSQQHYYITGLVLRPGEKLVAHRHDFYEFFVVIRGEFLDHCNGKATPVGRRQGHVLRPGVDVHYLENASEKPAVLRNIAIGGGEFPSLLEASGLFPTPGGGAGADVIGGDPFRYFTLDEEKYAAFCSKTSLFDRLCRNPQAQEFLLREVTCDVLLSLLLPEYSAGAPQWFNDLCREMEREENFVAGLGRLRELSGYSREYLNRVFLKYTGGTPTAYINGLRLRHAAWLLRSTDRQVLEIAYDCGFENISYFNRLFKAHYQKTPGEYREEGKFFVRSI